MICPYCNQEMKIGFILTSATEPSYFMPEDSRTKGLIIEAVKIKPAEGLNSHYCQTCNYITTKLRDS